MRISAVVDIHETQRDIKVAGLKRNTLAMPGFFTPEHILSLGRSGNTAAF